MSFAIPPTISAPLTTKMLAQLIAHLGTSVQPGAGFVDPDPVHWILTHFRIPETADHNMPLEDYQQLVLRQAFTKDEHGNFPYSVIIWSDIKKSAKSTIAAGIVLWMAWNTPWGSIKIIANDLKQADSRVAYYVRRAIELHPEMRKLCKIRPSGYTIELPNRCRIEAIPIDPKGEAGATDTVVCFSELWGAQDKAAKRMWAEMTLSPMLYGKSFRMVETYAGFSGESELLEGLYLQGVKDGRLIEEIANQFDPPLPLYENISARMLCMWNDIPRLPWQTNDYYAQETAVLPPNEFLRIHRNQWVSSVDVFLPIEWWDSCRATEAIPPLNPEEPIILAMDAAVSGDCFGMVAVSGDGSGNRFIPRYIRAWSPPKGGKIDFQGTPENPGPERELRRMVEQYNVIEIAYDHFQLEDMAGRMKKELIVNMYDFGQQQPRLIADKSLFDKIRDQRMYHDGDPVLREHIQNANRKTEGDKLRIVKRSINLKIDLVVALSMATMRAEHWQL